MEPPLRPALCECGLVESLSVRPLQQKPSTATARAFVELLRSLRPAITSASRWEDVAAAVADAPAAAALPDRDRRRLFDSYVEAVRKLERARAARAEADFKVALPLSSPAAPQSPCLTCRIGRSDAV
jgi:FF domain